MVEEPEQDFPTILEQLYRSEFRRALATLIRLLGDFDQALHDALKRRAEGDLILLDEQDRTLWNRDQIDEGVILVKRALGFPPAQVGSIEVRPIRLIREMAAQEK